MRGDLPRNKKIPQSYRVNGGFLDNHADASDSASHPIPLGTDVAIFRSAPSSLVSREGHAVVHGFTHIPYLYQVKFAGERSVRERLVFRAFQTDPEALEKALAYIFRHDVLAASSHDEFFPDHRRF